MPQKLNKNQTKSRLRLVEWGERSVGVFGESERGSELSEENGESRKKVKRNFDEKRLLDGWG